MGQVLRLSAFALVGGVAFGVVMALLLLALNFIGGEWRPDWHIGESLTEWARNRPVTSDEPATAAGPGVETYWAWVAAIVLSFAYYLAVWTGWGRDRRFDTAYPRYEPPAGLSPAGVRQVLGMGFDQKSMGAEVLSLAVRGHLRLQREEAGGYVMMRTSAPSSELTPAERKLLQTLFRATARVWVRKSDGTRLRIAMETFRQHLEEEFEGEVYETHLRTVFLGLLISGSLFMAAAGTHEGALAGPDIVVMIATFLVLMFINVLFMRLMKAPTDLGRQILDQIEGFRMFLSIAEHERLKLADAPRLTQHMFAEYLAYAFAMDIELDWAGRFTRWLNRSIPSPLDYEWYGQTARAKYDMDLVGMVESLGGAIGDVVLEAGEE